ncbi:proline-rich transmembrane protein 1-like isoform X1 [Saccostrea echinata]|uniref:proline-rich transmembrane protein 1-like isoform X1 n=1 Tax=Saccostrea echinata TaxID=191078 RepID=UPI002A7F1267|nr:proline-rich transmembrane protein 1-like isoform X1 [Saccostrea echinata]XP_061195113.1 proline-rich transmembrane protein 1-like isoform X1 [Saccostrea echinata]
MSTNQEKTGPPPSYNQAAYPNTQPQPQYGYGNQYNQYPGSQYPPQGGVQGQYPGQFQQHNVVVAQPGPTMVVAQPPQQDWMVPAILSCLCCFWPTGIFAILAANKAKNAAAVGDVAEAQEQSGRARTLVIVSVVIGVIVIALSVILRVVLYSSYSRY